ncbi:hypothetical protein VPH35_076699 [Triticum aestivum]
MRMALEFSTCWLRRREQELVGYTVIGYGASLYQTTLAHTYVKPAAGRSVMLRGKERRAWSHPRSLPWCGRTEHSYSNRSSRYQPANMKWPRYRQVSSLGLAFILSYGHRFNLPY